MIGLSMPYHSVLSFPCTHLCPHKDTCYVGKKVNIMSLYHDSDQNYMISIYTNVRLMPPNHCIQIWPCTFESLIIYIKWFSTFYFHLVALMSYTYSYITGDWRWQYTRVPMLVSLLFFTQHYSIQEYQLSLQINRLTDIHGRVSSMLSLKYFNCTCAI